MNNLDKQYTALLQDILENGIEKKDRTGTGTLSVFGRTIRHDMKAGFPLLTTKRIYFKGIVTELLWFLRGDTNIKYLVDNGCYIWVGDSYKNYLNNWKPIGEGPIYINPLSQEEFINKIKTDDEFANKWGELGPVYGKQWRDWGDTIDLHPVGKGVKYFVDGIDQIANLIRDLKTNPDSRRLMVSAWNVGELDQMVLPPCHYGFQVYTRELSFEERKEILYNKFRKGPIIVNEKSYVECAPTDINFEYFNIPTRAISLMWNQRSCDVLLGIPFNIASYGLLLTMIADEVNMVPDELIGNLGDTHLYLNHIEQAKEQIGRDLTDEERYHIWFDNNYETGMERYFDPNKLPNFDDPYYVPTPKRTREPYPLPKVSVRDGIHCSSVNDVILENYKSHPSIKAPLSN